jgi:hypothetical protein
LHKQIRGIEAESPVFGALRQKCVQILILKPNYKNIEQALISFCSLDFFLTSPAYAVNFPFTDKPRRMAVFSMSLN